MTTKCNKIPIFLRGTAEKKVTTEAERLVKEDNRDTVKEKDLVDALFAKTPFGFHGPLKNDLDEINIDYTKYGHSK